MLKTEKGTNDGINIHEFKRGEVYTVGKSLFNSFVNMEACKLVEGKKETPVKENKAKKTPVKEDK